MKRKWVATIDDTGGEYEPGFVTFYAENVFITGRDTLDVDGYEMKFDGWIEECELAVDLGPGRPDIYNSGIPDIYSEWGII